MKTRLALCSLFAAFFLVSFGQTAADGSKTPVKKATTTTTKTSTTTTKTRKPVKKPAPKTAAKTTTRTSTTKTTTTKPAAGHGSFTQVNGTTNNTGNLNPNGTKTTVGGGKPVVGGGTDPGINPNNTNTNTGTNTGTSILPTDATTAIKQALSNGIALGVTKVAVTDGYFGNSLIKIPFPKDASLVETTLREIGMGSTVDNATLSLNRAAESAASQATPIFINAISSMTITDALNMVSSTQPDACTQFLKATTNEQLVASFKPAVTNALNTTNATKYWGEVMALYNKIPLVGQIDTDLPDYVTRQAINGLFVMIAKEEANIRQNPLGQTSPVIKKVFGSVKH